MVSLEALRSGGLRAYELGRLRSAARACWLLLPVIAACGWISGAAEQCACVGVVLVAVAVALRWRSLAGSRHVAAGLAAGAVPLVAGLFAARCGFASAAVVVAALSGAWLGRRLARDGAGPSSFVAAASVAVLVASLGCVALGVVSLLVVAGGLLLGGGIGFVLTRASR